MDERLWLTNWNRLYVKNEIHLKKAIAPLYVGFKITENCNQRCRHCWAGKNKISHHSLDEIKVALEKIKLLNPYHVTITGGEPLLHDSWLEILQFAKNNFPVIELFTNGVLLNENHIQILSELMDELDYIQLSLDGLKETYKKQRGSDDFDTVINNIKCIVQYGINVRINMTVTHYNIDEIVEVYELVRNLGVTSFSVSPVYPLRRGERLVPLVDYERYLFFGNKIEKIHSKSKSDMNLTVIYPIEIQSKSADYTVENEIHQFNTDLLHWTVDGKGDIFHFMDQFPYDELKIGNIYQNAIEELSERDFQIQTSILSHSSKGLKCAHCSLAASCPGIAYANSFPELAFSYKRCTFNETAKYTGNITEFGK